MFALVFSREMMLVLNVHLSSCVTTLLFRRSFMIQNTEQKILIKWNKFKLLHRYSRKEN